MSNKKAPYADKGFKLTPQRLAIAAYLRESTGHPSAEDVYRAMLEKFPTMSFATVYNTLELLRRRGMVKELALSAGKKRFDPHPEPHHHLVCVTCKKIVDVRSEGTPEVPAGRRAGFTVLGCHIEFFGVCPECRAA